MRPEIKIAFKHFITSSRGGFLITNERSEILYAHNSFVEKTGFSIDQMIGQRPGNLWGGQMSRMYYYDFWRRISIDRKPFYDKVQNRHSLGELYPDILSIVPLCDIKKKERLYVHLMPIRGCKMGEYSVNQIASCIGSSNVSHDFLSWFMEFSCGDKKYMDIKNLSHEFAGLSVIDFFNDFFINDSMARYAYRIDDFLLIRRAKIDKKAFSLLYQKYYSNIFDYVRKRWSNENHIAAEDITQDVFFRAFRAIDEFSCSNASYKTYLIRVAHNVLIDMYRSQNIARCDRLSDDISDNGSNVTDSIFLAGLLRTLSFFERDIFLRKHYYGYGLQEIADHYGISLDALKARLRRIKNKLRKME